MRTTHFLPKLLAIACLILPGCQPESQVSPLCSKTESPRIPKVLGAVSITPTGTIRAIISSARTGYTYVAGMEYITAFKGTETDIKLPFTGGDRVSMGVDETDGTVYVVDEYYDRVTVIRGIEILGIVPTVGEGPRQVAVEPQSGFAHIVSPYRGPLPGEKRRPFSEVEGDILVLKGTQVIDNLNFGRFGLDYLVTDPIDGYVYVGGGSAEGSMVAVLKDLKEIARYKTRELGGFDVNQCTGEVYAFAHGGLYLFKDGKLVESVELKNNGPMGKIRVNSASGEVYLTYHGGCCTPSSPAVNGRVIVFKNMKQVGEILTGTGFVDLAIDPLTGNTYVTTFGGLDIQVLNGTHVVMTIPLTSSPYGIAINSANGWVYAMTLLNGTVTVLGYPENKPYPSYP